MIEFKVSLDTYSYSSKPSTVTASYIADRIAGHIKIFNKDNINRFINLVAKKGLTFCPATFKNGKDDFSEGKKRKENFEQIQLFALDFDGGISFEEVKDRAGYYDLPILFAYETFTSRDQQKFRIVFLNDVSITDVRVAKLVLKVLITIFPEADRQSKSVVQMYYGSNKGLLFFDESLPQVNIESLIRNTYNYLEDKYGAKHYRRHIEKLSRDTGVALNEKKLLDITLVDDLAQTSGADSNNGKNLTNSTNSNITHFVRKFPKYLKINFGESCTNSLCEKKRTNYHYSYRSSDLGTISTKCQLFQEFLTGSRRLEHVELFGLATNLVDVDTGVALLKNTLKKYSYYDDRPEKYRKWDQDLRYIRGYGYKPYSCNGFCPHNDSCTHGTNILSTAKPKNHQIERLSNYVENYVKIEEAEEYLRQKLIDAMNAGDNKWYIITAQTAIGKTKMYLELIKDTAQKVLIAVPTNKLKREILERARALGIDIKESPSIHEIKDDLSEDTWSEIDFLHKSGRSIIPYCKKAIRENHQDSALLRQYLKELDQFNNSDVHGITTHKKLLTMDTSKYDFVIVDEDIIFNAIIQNKTDITVLDLKILRKKIAPGSAIFKKIEKVLKGLKDKQFFTLPAIDYDRADDGKPMGVDLPSFCSATHFCYRKASDKESDLKEDCISFLNPVKFKANTKYIMLSATVNETVCEYYFGKGKNEFFECPKVEITGTLNQYYDKSMSRACIGKDRNIIERIKKWSGFERTITFLKYEKVGNMHFGNTAGRNDWEGENIDVIGTPHQQEWIYKLFAYSIGQEFDIGANLNPSAIVEHNGFRYRFSTYDDEVLRAIQFYLLESELEQAVGRARLLRKDCTVNLFSNFLLPQANLMKFEYDEDDEK